VSPIIDPLVGLHATDTRGRRITIGDVEHQLRSLGGSAQGALQASKATAGAAVAVAGAVLVAASYLLGRRRGKRRASVLEIRRV
jgi:hypothetical protein